MTFVHNHGTYITVTAEMTEDAEVYRSLLDGAMKEMSLGFTHGPRYGPHRRQKNIPNVPYLLTMSKRELVDMLVEAYEQSDGCSECGGADVPTVTTYSYR